MYVCMYVYIIYMYQHTSLCIHAHINMLTSTCMFSANDKSGNKLYPKVPDAQNASARYHTLRRHASALYFRDSTLNSNLPCLSHHLSRLSFMDFR